MDVSTSALALVLASVLVGCVPPSARTSPTSAEPRHLTSEEIDAIPNAFPATLVAPRDRTFAAMYASWLENNPAEVGQILSIYLRLGGLSVPITVEECGTPNAYYKLASKTIHICYELFGYANALTQRARDTADSTTNDLLMFAVLHEVAHALIDQLGIAIEGNEEDAADELALLTLTNYDDSSLAESLVTVPAQFFELHGSNVEPEDRDEHSPAAARAFDAVCLLYGRHRDPKAKRRLGDRADACVAWTAAVIERWNARLAPYTRLDNGRTFSRTVGAGQ